MDNHFSRKAKGLTPCFERATEDKCKRSFKSLHGQSYFDDFCTEIVCLKNCGVYS